MKGFVLASAAAIALGLGGVGAAHAQAYGNGPYGYGNPNYGNPGFYGNPGYGTPGYGNPGYGNANYGHPGYGNQANGSYYGGNAFAFVLPDQVRHAERELANRGFYNGPIDGNMSASFSQALQGYQNANGLPSTGGLNPPTMQALNLSMHPYCYAPNGNCAPNGYGQGYGSNGYGYNGAGYNGRHY